MGELNRTCSGSHGEPEEKMHIEQASRELNEQSLHATHENTLDRHDPHNWSRSQKIYITGLISILALAGQFSSALINPGFVSMSKSLGVTVQQASYCATVGLLFQGVTPMFFVPFANVYGRRILYTSIMILAPAGNILSAAAPNYGGVIAGRVLYGIGSSIPLGIGAATICDLFRHHERGLYMGIYIVCTNNGPHLAPIVGGYISQNLGWRWCFWIPAIYQGCLWLLLIFTLPETLYSNKEGNKLQGLTYSQKLVFHSKVLDRPIRLRDFGTTFRMIKYAAVILPTIYCATANTYGSLLFGITGSEIGTTIYKFKTSQTGLFQGIPLTIGCFIGEMCAGWVSDIFANTYARRHNGHWKAESRLLLMPLCTTLCIGTAVYGFCIQNRKPWIDSAISMAVSGFGLQVATTMVYTYCTDSYEAQSGEIGSVIYCFKAVIACTVTFYALPFCERVGYTAAFSIMAGVNAIFLIPMAFLFIFGETIRKMQGVPKEHGDL